MSIVHHLYGTGLTQNITGVVVIHVGEAIPKGITTTATHYFQTILRKSYGKQR
jgi:hypothetical protein